MIRNHAYLHRYLGFKSLSLRQQGKKSDESDFFSYKLNDRDLNESVKKRRLDLARF